ncbi:MAG: excinuclease ABC subunit UvrA [Anaerolineae bacterium]
MNEAISITGAYLHNLKHIDVSIPKNQLVVLTGLSGSGKSTLAFDTLLMESQREFMESLGFVPLGVGKPTFERITGLMPAISVDQYHTNRSPRSTLGTASNIFSYLRVLYAQIGDRRCLNCGATIPPAYDVGAQSDDDLDLETTYPCPSCGVPVPNLGMAHFSFNKPQGACPTCTGIGVVHTGDIEKILDTNLTLEQGAVRQWSTNETRYHLHTLQAASQHYEFDFNPAQPLSSWPESAMSLLIYGGADHRFLRQVHRADPPDTVSKGRFEGIIPNLIRRYSESDNPTYKAKLGALLIEGPCPDCAGTRLRPESRSVTVGGRTIVETSSLPLTSLVAWLDALERETEGETQRVADSVIDELKERIGRLLDVGLGYLDLARSTPTLSGGETQRLKLAALLGSSLTGVLYVLDEPTIGMHPRDTGMLVRVLRRIRDLGNTVLVVEHDLDLMRASDTLIDMGPGAGQHGGKITAVGTPDEVRHNPRSLTGQYLSGAKSVPVPATWRPGNGSNLTIHGARGHNLKQVTVNIPLGKLIAVVGVSGSGKSSLILDTLGRAAERRFHGSNDPIEPHDQITGWENVDDAILIDQTAIGRTPRSNAATYTDVFTSIRQTYASLPEAHDLEASHFSFNTPGGRCERCEGAGVLTVNMQILPDVEVRCPVCQGRRFKPEILNVKFRDRNIADVLELTIEEALAHFQGVNAVARKLQVMVDVGLGYLKLGQPATMLSGGEAQRIKLAKELSRSARGHILYLLDEPTTGLHPDDVTRLLAVLQRLVDAGHTVLVIEHNTELIRAADWVIEMGPEGGTAGGYIIAEGTPDELAANPASLTAPYLA